MRADQDVRGQIAVDLKKPKFDAENYEMYENELFYLALHESQQF